MTQTTKQTKHKKYDQVINSVMSSESHMEGRGVGERGWGWGEDFMISITGLMYMGHCSPSPLLTLDKYVCITESRTAPLIPQCAP